MCALDDCFISLLQLHDLFTCLHDLLYVLSNFCLSRQLQTGLELTLACHLSGRAQVDKPKGTIEPKGRFSQIFADSF